ncbi:MAG: xanthine dehydrogenase family protein [Candidatus Eiseniibacteriota bacterium]|nr:MAG: xanthine dehydrogenase family protein [Candidatus Eisenbacteria bacterium]
MAVVGRRVRRVESLDRVKGVGSFTDDLTYAGMLHAAVVRSPVARARIKHIETGRALRRAGAEAVFTFQDIPGRNVVPIILEDQPFLAEEYVNYVGEPIAVVLASERETARAAAKEVSVRLEELPPILDLLKARRHPRVHLFGEDNVFKHLRIRRGDTAAAFSSCDVIVENEYRTPYQEHAYIEPEAMIAIPHPDGTIEIRGSMQCPFYVRKAVTSVLGLPESRVWVVQAATGGAFGGKEDVPSLLACQVALPAWKLKKPVKLVYDRTEDMVSTSKRHPSWVRYKSGATRDGVLKAVEVEYVIDGGAYSTLSPAVLYRGTVHAAGPYRCDNVKVDSYVVATNRVPTGAFRGFGSPQILFAAESQMDQLAERLGLHPAELRRRNLLRAGDTTITGQKLTVSVGLEETLDRVLEASGWPTGQKRDDGVGYGLSTVFYGVGLGAAGKHLARTGARVIVHADGSVTFSVGTTELGQGMTTVLSQIVSEELGTPLECVQMIAPDTSRVPDSGPTVASRSTTMSGNALKDACGKIRDVLLAEASRALRIPVSDLRIVEGAIVPAKEEGPSMPIDEAIKSCTTARLPLSAEGWHVSTSTSWDDRTGQGDAYVTYAWATNLAKVRVDRETGEVTVLKMWAAHDVGKAVNPTLAEGQIEGGILQGLGFALTENMFTDERGVIVNPDFSTYIIPTAADSPEIVSLLVEHPYPDGPHGAKGFGEQPLMGVAPAVANAVRDAVGVRITELPITPEKIWNALRSSRRVPVTQR